LGLAGHVLQVAESFTHPQPAQRSFYPAMILFPVSGLWFHLSNHEP
jgi:hypothetical protein